MDGRRKKNVKQSFGNNKSILTIIIVAVWLPKEASSIPRTPQNRENFDDNRLIRFEADEE